MIPEGSRVVRNGAGQWVITYPGSTLPNLRILPNMTWVSNFVLGTDVDPGLADVAIAYVKAAIAEGKVEEIR